MENKQIARLLAETADLMEIAGEDGFRIRSYRNAAAGIESYPERIIDIVRNPEAKVTGIPGVGKGIAAAIVEIAQRGSFDRRDEMLAKYPASALELLKIQGLGPKSIALLYQHHNVRTVDDLERICREQKLRDLPRMGTKLEEKVLRSIEAYRKSAGRYLLSFGQRIATELIEELQEVPGVEKVDVAGSLRRGKETIGDLDLLVTGAGASDVLERVVTHPKVHEVLGQGVNKASVQYGLEGLQVDVRALPRESFGAAMQYFTGSKEHNVTLRTIAIKQGLTLNEYGLFTLDANARVAGETEEEIYERLGISGFLPNCARTPENWKRPRRGGFRSWCTYRTFAEMYTCTRLPVTVAPLFAKWSNSAAALGYEYVAITDHSKALAMANGLDEQRVIDFAATVRKLNRDGLPIRVFSGLECDILRDGSMDLAEDALAQLDFVIGSVHSFLNIEAAEMTDRLLRAVESPSMRVMGHPTGRRLLQREAYPFDFDAVAKRAVERGVWLEVNASPERLDLYAPLLRAAKNRGAKFTISTDAWHQPKHLHNMRYGVTMARRGWLEPGDVMNTFSAEQFAEALSAKPR